MSRYYPETYDSLAHKMMTYAIARKSQARFGGRLIDYLKPAWSVARNELKIEAHCQAKITAKEQELRELKEKRGLL